MRSFENREFHACYGFSELSIPIYLEPDVAKTFRSSAAVSQALRSLLRLSATTRGLTKPPRQPQRQGRTSDLGVKSCGRPGLIGAALPEILKASTEFAAAEGDDGVGPFHRPVHSGALQPGTNHHLTSRLHHAGRGA